MRRLISALLLMATVIVSLAAVPAAQAAPEPCHTWKVNRILGESIRAGAGGEGGEGRCITFPARAGDRIRFEVRPADPATAPLISSVSGPGGAVCPFKGTPVFTCTIATTGTQTLTVRTRNPITAPVSFSALPWSIDDPASCPTLAYGDTWSGFYGTCAVFSGSVGDRIAIRTKGFDPGYDAVLDLLGPSLANVCARVVLPDSTGELICTLTATGQHRILVLGEGDKSGGGYDVELERLNDPNACKAVKANGATNAFNLRVAGNKACFTFEGAAGQRFRVRQAYEESGGASSYFASPATIEVVAADGTVECPAAAATETTCAVTTTGQHTVRITPPPSGLGSTINNSLAIRRLAPPLACAAFRVGPAPTTGSVRRAAELDCFAVDARPGEILRLRLAPLTAGVVTAEVVGPDGATICAAATDAIRTCTATVGGTQSVIIGRQLQSFGEAFPYALSIQRPVKRPIGCEAIGVGRAPIAIETTEPAEAACLQLWGEKGDVIRMRSEGPLSTEFLDAKGVSCVAVSWATCVLTATGHHTLLVGASASDIKRIGTEFVTIQRLNRPSGCTRLTPGASPVGATLVDSEMDCFTVKAEADQFISVQVTQRVAPTEPVTYELIGPNGRVVCGPTTNVSLSCDAPTAGRYTVLVGGRGGATGKYQVRARLIS